MYYVFLIFLQVAMHSNEAMAKMFANKDNTLSPDEVTQVTHSSVITMHCSCYTLLGS